MAILCAAIGVWRDIGGGFWLYSGCHERLIFLFGVADLAIDPYLLGWTSTKQARDFFSAEHKIA